MHCVTTWLIQGEEVSSAYSDVLLLAEAITLRDF
ncbi:hypothetical protein VINI7043_01225 [Vibrio nigripulchritudo ATCC 27043]|nr:hypothetical protein VINI7043_01225 [Vibrio nigripulchritudo ATCC 27043]